MPQGCSKRISPRGDSAGMWCGVTNTRGGRVVAGHGESTRMVSSEKRRFRSVGEAPVRWRFLVSTFCSDSASSAVSSRGTQ